MRFIHCFALSLVVSLTLVSCYHPPYNNFTPYHRGWKDAATGAVVGGTVGAVLGSTTAATGLGAGIGAAAFTIKGAIKENKGNTIRYLRKKGDMEFFQYGDTSTLIVPTDRYFLFNSPHLNDLCYPFLMRMVQLIKFYPNRTIYVAGFTDDVGSHYHKKQLSQARAETIVTFLWANGISAQLLHAEGYADQHDVSDNRLIHGSAQNRRIEIQWFNSPQCCQVPSPLQAAMK